MPRSIPQRLLRLAIQVAIVLALMIGVLLRLRSANLAIWEIILRPVIIFAIGMLLLGGRRWARWPFAALCAAYAWWYFQAATRGSLPAEYRLGTGLGALLEVACGVLVLVIAPERDAPGRGSAAGSATVS